MNFKIHVQVSDSYFSGSIDLAQEEMLKSEDHRLRITVTRRTTMHSRYEAEWQMYNTKGELLAEGCGALKHTGNVLTAQFWFPYQASA